MDDHHGGVALDIADFQDQRCMVRADDHREPITHIPGANGIAIGVQDLIGRQAVLQRLLRDDGLYHHSKLTCHGCAVQPSMPKPTGERRSELLNHPTEWPMIKLWPWWNRRISKNGRTVQIVAHKPPTW